MILSSSLPGCTIERVRFRYQCQHVPTFASEAVGLTASIGLAFGLPGRGGSPADLLRLADAATVIKAAQDANKSKGMQLVATQILSGGGRGGRARSVAGRSHTPGRAGQTTKAHSCRPPARRNSYRKKMGRL